MSNAKKIAAGAALAALLTGTSATVASATAWFGGDITIGDSTNGSVWYVNEEGSIDHSDFYLNGVDFDQVVCGTYGGLMIDGDTLSDNDDLDLTEEVATGDQVVTGTGSFLSGDLTASIEYRVYAEGDLLRTAYTLTNDTGSAITFTPSVYEDPSDGSSDDATSSSGDNLADLDDVWYTTFGDIGGSPASAVYTKFWGNPNQITVVDVNDFSFKDSQTSDDVIFGDITLEPGESYLWVFFHSYKTYDNSGDDAADIAAAVAAGDEAVAEFGDSLLLTGRLARGLDTSLSTNWSYTAEEEDSSLPNTGFDSTSVLQFAAILVVGGAAVAVTRRRKA